MLGAAFVALALAAGVQPAAGDFVEGAIAFPRRQPMSIQVLAGDQLAVTLGFDGRCTHGGMGELWISHVPASGTASRQEREVRGPVVRNRTPSPPGTDDLVRVGRARALHRA